VSEILEVVVLLMEFARVDLDLLQEASQMVLTRVNFVGCVHLADVFEFLLGLEVRDVDFGRELGLGGLLFFLF